MSDLPPPIPAATLILMRPAPAGGPPELLMLERTQSMAFAAGALVFPGGRIDPEDHEAALALAPELEDGAAPRVAAIRETIEESGLAPGIDPVPDAETAAALRAGLAAGESLGGLIDRHRLTLDLDALMPFARWCPNFRETRRFDTLFFLAEAPAGVASIHAPEAVRLFWASAEAVLAEIAAGRAHAIFPTRRNLERLARLASVDEARAHARAHEVRKVTPWIEQRDGVDWLCIPDDLGYPVTSELLETARRM